jgi:hypothetical protein
LFGAILETFLGKRFILANPHTDKVQGSRKIIGTSGRSEIIECDSISVELFCLESSA